MIIDCHAHLVPASLLGELKASAGAFPSVRIIEDGGDLAFSFSGKKPTRPVSNPLSDIAARLSWMDAQGIEKQVVGGWLDMFGYEIAAEEGVRWSRTINDHLLDLGRTENRFVPLATVPLQNGAKAAETLRAAHQAGFKGAMIGTQPKGVGGVLDDADLDEFWKTADSLGSILFIHPVFECGDNRVHDYGMANAVGRITDTLIAVSRIIYSGHITRYPGVRIIVGIGGSALPYVVGRLRRNYALEKGNVSDPDAALARLYYDTILQDVPALDFLIQTVGADRVMMGSDMPFPIGDPTPRDIVQKAKLTSEQRAGVGGDVARRLLGL